MLLEPEQEQLLVDLVEAERRLPRDQRQKFIVARSISVHGVGLIHGGWSGRRVFEGDLETLASVGLIQMSYGHKGTHTFFVTPLGFEYYSSLMANRGAPVEVIEDRVRRFLDSKEFQTRHPRAFQKWSEAERLLWGEDSAQNLTTIGHLCREALQEFATSLLVYSKVQGANPDPSKTIARVEAVLEASRQKLGERRRAFLDALLVYWGTVSDLVQRQEHGAQKEGEPLLFADAVRVVLQTMVVMYEVDSSIR